MFEKLEEEVNMKYSRASGEQMYYQLVYFLCSAIIMNAINYLVLLLCYKFFMLRI
jgi:hypothetical protein